MVWLDCLWWNYVGFILKTTSVFYKRFIFIKKIYPCSDLKRRRIGAVLHVVGNSSIILIKRNVMDTKPRNMGSHELLLIKFESLLRQLVCVIIRSQNEKQKQQGYDFKAYSYA